MLAGEFATGAATLDGHAGEINLYLVECAALALPPERLAILAQFIQGFAFASFLPAAAELASGASASTWSVVNDIPTFTSSRWIYSSSLQVSSFAVCQKWNGKYSNLAPFDLPSNHSKFLFVYIYWHALAYTVLSHLPYPGYARSN